MLGEMEPPISTGRASKACGSVRNEVEGKDVGS